MKSNPQQHIINLMEIIAVDKDAIDSLQSDRIELQNEIMQLRRRIIEQDATIDRQAAQLVQYAKMLDDERATVAQLRANVVQLRTALDAVPVNSIRRYYAFTHYDVHAANDAGYTTQQFDSDDMWIGMWLESLECDA